MILDFTGAALPLGPDDVTAIAAALDVDAPALRAVIEVEAAGAGFLPDKRPKILYEAHLFGRLTGHQWDAAWPSISAPAWDRSLYGPGGAHQYERLELAMRLDRDAALSATSWGLPQILGLNHKAAGFAEVEHFVSAMMASERAQLEALATFLQNAKLDHYLRPHRWADFARGYNGPGQVEHYALALSGAFVKWQSYPAPVPAVVSRVSDPMAWHGADPLPETATLQRGMRGTSVMALQRRLAELGYPVSQDGVYGKQTAGAVVAFQRARGLQCDRLAGPATLTALNAVGAPCMRRGCLALILLGLLTLAACAPTCEHGRTTNCQQSW